MACFVVAHSEPLYCKKSICKILGPGLGGFNVDLQGREPSRIGHSLWPSSGPSDPKVLKQILMSNLFSQVHSLIFQEQVVPGISS